MACHYETNLLYKGRNTLVVVLVQTDQDNKHYMLIFIYIPIQNNSFWKWKRYFYSPNNSMVAIKSLCKPSFRKYEHNRWEIYE